MTSHTPTEDGIRSETTLQAEGSARAATGEFKIERVFPIRIQAPKRGPTISVTSETSAAPQKASGAEQEIDKTSPGISISISPLELNPIDSPSVSTGRLATTTLPASSLRYVTDRFSYLPSGDNSSSETSSLGNKIYRCEDEPIHIPRAIQSFGALVAVKENEGGLFIVRIVSENSQVVTGFEPEVLFNLRSFTDLLIQSDKTEFISRVKALRSAEERTNPDVFTLSLTSLIGKPTPLFCAMHLNTDMDLVVCEFELESDVFNPRHRSAHGLPKEPVHLSDNDPSEEELLHSTTSRSRSLYAVSIARERNRNLGPLELFQVLSEIQNQLGTASVLSELLDTVVGLVQELTSFHRIMVYQFDETAAGSVVSELVDLRASTDLYRGLHFPAADIPKQARELYLINTIRILYDREQETSRLLCRTLEDGQTPLNLKYSYLRAFSPVHLKYLKNMGVQASMSISLIVQGKLWGLISCHSYGSGMRVSLPVRELCRSLGNIASTNVEKLLYASRIQARKPLSNAPPQNSPSAYIAASTSDLLEMFGADFGFLVIKGEARTIGKLVAYRECVILLQYIRQQSFKTIFHSSNISLDCPEANHSTENVSTLSGMLVVPLAQLGADFLVFLRRGKQKEIHWAGNPHDKTTLPGTGFLQPRNSFKKWSESVLGTSREWTEDQVESAVVLSTLYGRFIDVWRQKEAIVQKNKMTRLLIRNAGHEVRTPLNSIINYLEVALEETLDESARLHLQKSLQASKSLVFVVNDLLRLTEAENADFNAHEDNLDLRAMSQEVIAAFKDESERKKLKIQFEDDVEIPQTIRCDPSGLRQVLSNLMANAIEHSNSGGGPVQVGLKLLNITDTKLLIEVSFQDRGSGLSEQDLDGIFQDFEQILDEDDNQNPETSAVISKPQTEHVSIGLGLATTARFVRLNHGQISIASQKGQGTRVSIHVPFRKSLRFHRDKRPATEISLPTPPSGNDPGNRTGTSTSSSGTSRPSPPQELKDHQYPSASKRRKESSLGSPVVTSAGSSTPPVAPEIDVSALSPISPSETKDHYPFPRTETQKAQHRFHILVAEDNPLNSRLIETRLKKAGHDVKVTVDGQACADAFKSNPAYYDVVLMDIQMPLVDGVSSTRLIRDFVKVSSPKISECAKSYGRVPIIAVSASLSEQSRGAYIDSGFDGWILKPIDFKRLGDILTAIQDKQMREVLLYGNASWKSGGWFKMEPSEFV
ncbi:Cyanobacterial phytochrome B [Lachnellula suecica]|uniref:Cyanobacterial phytochrome B n=1 Tax=Lachnellula suecica TaxID=602035 RepID=A0A8T9CBV3_9HELO|nr:Cyanobacterial phytochrome B [Lachnellula suecica]